MANSTVKKTSRKTNSGDGKTRSGPRKKDAWEELVPVGRGTGMGDYLRRFWQPVAVAKDVPPDKAIPIRIMGEDLTLYRGATGTPHIVARLPFIDGGAGRLARNGALAIAQLEHEETGSDLSLVAVEASAELSRGRLRKAFNDARMPANSRRSSW